MSLDHRDLCLNRPTREAMKLENLDDLAAQQDIYRAILARGVTKQGERKSHDSGMTVPCRSAPCAPPPYCHINVAHILVLGEQEAGVALARQH